MLWPPCCIPAVLSQRRTSRVVTGLTRGEGMTASSLVVPPGIEPDSPLTGCSMPLSYSTLLLTSQNRGLNPRPPSYQDGALPLSYSGVRSRRPEEEKDDGTGQTQE